jgi:hypothetical protein
VIVPVVFSLLFLSLVSVCLPLFDVVQYDPPLAIFSFSCAAFLLCPAADQPAIPPKPLRRRCPPYSLFPFIALFSSLPSSARVLSSPLLSLFLLSYTRDHRWSLEECFVLFCPRHATSGAVTINEACRRGCLGPLRWPLRRCNNFDDIAWKTEEYLCDLELCFAMRPELGT